MTPARVASAAAEVAGINTTTRLRDSSRSRVAVGIASDRVRRNSSVVTASVTMNDWLVTWNLHPV